MDRHKLVISNPCPKDFESMHGNGPRRFCDHCQKHVHNLSDMTRDEAVELLRENASSHLCVVYRFDASDRVVFREDAPRPNARGASQLAGLKKLLAAAALIPVLSTLPACDTGFEEPAVIEQPCDYDGGEVRPIDLIMEAEDRFVEKLRDFLGLEPEVEMIMGEMVMEVPPPPPEPFIMGALAEPVEAPIPEPAPQPLVEPAEPQMRLMGDIAIDVDSLD